MHQYMEELSGSNSIVSSKALAGDYESPVEISDISTLLELEADMETARRSMLDAGGGKPHPKNGTAAIVRSKLSITLNGEHLMFKGDNLGTAHQWCVD